jgi:hypothetical protein
MAMSADQRLRSARRLKLAHVYTEYFAEDPDASVCFWLLLAS